MCYDADMFCACSLALLCILDCRCLFLYVVYGLCVTVLIVQDSFIILTNDPSRTRHI
nr:BPK_HP1_G0044050.mRNA.1.CDS.1 [Saccharomyces cerevisiae]